MIAIENTNEEYKKKLEELSYLYADVSQQEMEMILIDEAIKRMRQIDSQLGFLCKYVEPSDYWLCTSCQFCSGTNQKGKCNCMHHGETRKRVSCNEYRHG